MNRTKNLISFNYKMEVKLLVMGNQRKMISISKEGI